MGKSTIFPERVSQSVSYLHINTDAYTLPSPIPWGSENFLKTKNDRLVNGEESMFRYFIVSVTFESEI